MLFSNEAHLNGAIRIKRKFVMTSSEAKNMSNKMTKDTLPQDFSLGLALVDAVPVLFFGATAIVAGTILESPLFVVGAIISFISGAVKVLWKIIAALKKKNIWWMFVQMRITMPIGLLVLIAGFVSAIKHTDFSLLLHTVASLPYIIFFALGLLGNDFDERVCIHSRQQQAKVKLDRANYKRRITGNVFYRCTADKA